MVRNKAWVARRLPIFLAMAGKKMEITKQEMLNMAKHKLPQFFPSSNPVGLASGLGALKAYLAADKERYCHISGSPYQVKNFTHHNWRITTGISDKEARISLKTGNKSSE